MLYLLHHYDTPDNPKGWEVAKQSENLEDFDDIDKWAFNFILSKGTEYVKIGTSMWTIENI